MKAKAAVKVAPAGEGAGATQARPKAAPRAVRRALAADEIEALRQGRHADPFSRLGPHHDGEGRTCVRAFMPEAQSLSLAFGKRSRKFKPLHDDGLFEVVLEADLEPGAYRLQVTWADGST